MIQSFLIGHAQQYAPDDPELGAAVGVRDYADAQPITLDLRAENDILLVTDDLGTRQATSEYPSWALHFALYGQTPVDMVRSFACLSSNAEFIPCDTSDLAP